MNEKELLKEIDELMKLASLDKKINRYKQDIEYLQRIETGIALLKLQNKISKDNIDKILIELVGQVNDKYKTNYVYLGNYIITIDSIINDIHNLMCKCFQDKIKELTTGKLWEVLDGNE